MTQCGVIKNDANTHALLGRISICNDSMVVGGSICFLGIDKLFQFLHNIGVWNWRKLGRPTTSVATASSWKGKVHNLVSRVLLKRGRFGYKDISFILTYSSIMILYNYITVKRLQ